MFAGVVPPAVQCVPRQTWRNGSALLGEHSLAEEVPVAFSYDGMAHAVLMATPDDLEDFALGFSHTEGIITAPAEADVFAARRRFGRCPEVQSAFGLTGVRWATFLPTCPLGGRIMTIVKAEF